MVENKFNGLPRPGSKESRVELRSSALEHQKEAAQLKINLFDPEIIPYVSREEQTEFDELKNSWVKNVERKLNLYASKTNISVLGEVIPHLQHCRKLLKSCALNYARSTLSESYLDYDSELVRLDAIKDYKITQTMPLAQFEEGALMDFGLGKISFADFKQAVDSLADALTK